MQKIFKILFLILLSCSAAYAGNGDRAGQAGATQLLINPYARTSGLGGSNISLVEGLESQYLNIGGLTKTKKTELIFSRTAWLMGTGININTFGFSQKLGQKNFIALGIMSLNFGQIQITTTDLPEGGIGTYSPQFMNIGASYARQFTPSISGGVTFRIVSESIANIQGLGMALDAGIQYTTGSRKHIGFGMALRNAGPKMSYSGDGLSTKALFVGSDKQVTLASKSQSFELPLLMNIGGHYRFDLGTQHQLFTSATFVSNAFSKDQYCVGLEYRFKKIFMLRTGYVYEQGIFKMSTRTTAFTGPTLGFTVEVPYKDKASFGFDYSYRDTNPFQGVHTFGARICF